MSGPPGVMDWCSPPRLKLKLMTLFLLASTSIVCLHGNPVTGVDYNLHCVNDYLYTINCSLSIPPSGNISDTNGFYWLTITYYEEEFECKLTNINEDYFCSVKTSSPFDDLDIYKILLCHNQNDGSKICDMLDDEYIPVEYIKPNAPCCLTVSHKSSKWHFIWKSTYEDYDFITLGENLKYQLYYYQRGDKHNVKFHEINIDSKNYSVDDPKFVPGTEYAARVRSSPNMAFYKGEWSHWSSEVHWKSTMNGVDYNLHCVNDYLYTINCSLSIPPSGNISDTNGFYWLTITYYEEEFECKLTNINEDYFCSVKTSSPFDDLDIYKILLCHNQNDGSKICDMLDDEYIPVEYIKPNAPCCLTVSHKSSKWHFIWKSTYEDYDFITLGENLKYQLYYYQRGDKHNVKFHEINIDSKNYSVDDPKFVPGTEYAARVRSSPNMAFYKGEWSHWSSEVHWKSTMNVHTDPPSNTYVSGLGKVFIPLCVMVPLLLLLCYAPVLKWRQSTFIPTPAPYFHTLYSDCHGDFKSWVVTQENTAKMLKAEETLQIDKLSKCADIQEEECQSQFPQQLMENSTYSNIIDPGCDTSLLGIPYAVSTMVPPSTPGSSQPGSPTEGDSGCWLCSHTSLERDPPFYCNEYCTLSAFQQSSPVTAGNHGSLLNRDDQSGCH